MLPFEQEEENLTRRFPREKTVARINEIQELKRRGYSIPEIKQQLH
jgi:DNA-binding transcriptional MerR regulator